MVLPVLFSPMSIPQGSCLSESHRLSPGYGVPYTTNGSLYKEAESPSLAFRPLTSRLLLASFQPMPCTILLSVYTYLAHLECQLPRTAWDTTSQLLSQPSGQSMRQVLMPISHQKHQTSGAGTCGCRSATHSRLSVSAGGREVLACQSQALS